MTAEVLTEFIDNLKKELIDVPPKNVWNFDETNVTDDPGARKCIVKRGTKYPENIMNSSKSSISIIKTGSAACAHFSFLASCTIFLLCVFLLIPQTLHSHLMLLFSTP